MSEKEAGKPEEEAIEVEAEIIDAEVVAEEKPKSRNDSAIFIAVAFGRWTSGRALHSNSADTLFAGGLAANGDDVWWSRSTSGRSR